MSWRLFWHSDVRCRRPGQGHQGIRILLHCVLLLTPSLYVQIMIQLQRRRGESSVRWSHGFITPRDLFAGQNAALIRMLALFCVVLTYSDSFCFVDINRWPSTASCCWASGCVSPTRN